MISVTHSYAFTGLKLHFSANCVHIPFDINAVQIQRRK